MYDTALATPSSSPNADDSTTDNTMDKSDASSAILSNDTQPVNDVKPTAVQVRFTGRMLNFTRLHIQGNDIDTILANIKAKLGQKRQSKMPVVVSYDELLELKALWDGLWALGLQPIGLVTGELDEEAEKLHIAIFPVDGQRIDGKHKPATPKAKTTIGAESSATKSSDKPSMSEASTVSSSETIVKPTVEMTAPVNADETKTSAPVPDNTKLTIDTHRTSLIGSHVEGDLVHNQILRSGQSINHVGGDLILTKSINAGAEAITDYSLHVYGKAEGRLVAGATGDQNAKIFCLKFNPSLVSVAGTYCLKENIPSEFINQAVQVSYVDGEGLVFEHLDTQ